MRAVEWNAVRRFRHAFYAILYTVISPVPVLRCASNANSNAICASPLLHLMPPQRYASHSEQGPAAVHGDQHAGAVGSADPGRRCAEHFDQGQEGPRGHPAQPAGEPRGRNCGQPEGPRVHLHCQPGIGRPLLRLGMLLFCVSSCLACLCFETGLATCWSCHFCPTGVLRAMMLNAFLGICLCVELVLGRFCPLPLTRGTRSPNEQGIRSG